MKIKKRKKRVDKPRAPRMRLGEFIGFRAPIELKENLKLAADATGRSLSTEAQFRLEKSFETTALTSQALTLAYGPRTAAIALIIARALHEAGTTAAFAETGTLDGAANWHDNAPAFHQARNAVDEILGSICPPGDSTPTSLNFQGQPDHPLTNINRVRGAGLAQGILQALTTDDVSGDLGKWAAPLREMLGSSRKRIASPYERSMAEHIQREKGRLTEE